MLVHRAPIERSTLGGEHDGHDGCCADDAERRPVAQVAELGSAREALYLCVEGVRAGDSGGFVACVRHGLTQCVGRHRAGDERHGDLLRRGVAARGEYAVNLGDAGLDALRGGGVAETGDGEDDLLRCDAVAYRAYGLRHCGDALSIRREGDAGGLRGEVHDGVRHAVHTLERGSDGADACGAGHALNGQHDTPRRVCRLLRSFGCHSRDGYLCLGRRVWRNDTTRGGRCLYTTLL